MQQPIPAVPATVPAENPDQDQPPAPPVTSPPSSNNWFDSLFNQKLPVQFGFRLGGAYSDNIYYQPKKTYDYILEASPYIAVTLGEEIKLDHALDQETIDALTDAGNLNYFHVSYNPVLRLYDKNTKLNDYDEDADGIYTHLFGKLTPLPRAKVREAFPAHHSGQLSRQLINRDVFTTTARANYIYSDQLSTYGTFSQTVNKYISNFLYRQHGVARRLLFPLPALPEAQPSGSARASASTTSTRSRTSNSRQAWFTSISWATGKFTLAGAGRRGNPRVRARFQRDRHHADRRGDGDVPSVRLDDHYAGRGAAPDRRERAAWR